MTTGTPHAVARAGVLREPSFRSDPYETRVVIEGEVLA